MSATAFQRARREAAAKAEVKEVKVDSAPELEEVKVTAKKKVSKKKAK